MTGNMIYLDILFLFNLIIDYLILALVKKDFFPEIKKRRLLIGACFSAGSYLIWFCLQETSLREVHNFMACLFMSIVLIWTFRIRSMALFCKTAILAAFYIFFLGGVGFFLQRIFWKKYQGGDTEYWILLGAIIIFSICFNFWKERLKVPVKRKECTYEVEIKRKTFSISLLGFYDSGNQLVSKWSGKGICVISIREAEQLMEKTEKERVSFLMTQKDFPWKIMTENLWSGIYCITFSTIGREKEWMPGIYADHIIVKKDGEVLAETKGLLGITAQRISKEKRFAVLLPADIFMN